jgi:hypothetical protein
MSQTLAAKAGEAIGASQRPVSFHMPRGPAAGVARQALENGRTETEICSCSSLLQRTAPTPALAQALALL